MHEKLFFDNRMALEPETVGEHVEVLLGTFSAHRSVLTEESVPPSLVYERGAYTLHVSCESNTMLGTFTAHAPWRRQCCPPWSASAAPAACM